MKHRRRMRGVGTIRRQRKRKLLQERGNARASSEGRSIPLATYRAADVHAAALEPIGIERDWLTQKREEPDR